jgi:putative cell wall-binding protein
MDIVAEPRDARAVERDLDQLMRSTLRTPIAATALLVVGAIAAGALSTLPSAPASAAASAVSSTTVRSALATTVYGAGVYTSPTSEPAQQAATLAHSDPAGAAAASTIAQYPIATWLGEWTTGSTLTSTLRQATAGAAASGTTAVFVTYAIPDRDCGGYSSGGFDEATYDSWIDTIAADLAGTRSTVIVEPDSLAMLTGTACSADVAAQRFRILNREVAAFTAAGVPSYLDAGNSGWVAPATMASLLDQAGVANARGFFSNVASYYPTASEQAYDQQVSALTGGAHYVIDTSRNGQGWRGTWCNGPGAGLGATPRVVDDGTALDALLWIKTPGASDGSCGGAPAAGDWYSAYAQQLVANAALQSPVSDATVDRIAGTDAYDTAARVATSAFDTASTVFVASRATFPDALSAGAAAGHDGAPVLLTAPDTLPTATAHALATLHPTHIVVVGGTAAVSETVADALRADAPVTRIAGPDRYATSADVSAATFDPGVGTAYLAVGANFPDALSGAAVAATTAANGPMLLVSSTSVPAPIAAELQRLRPRNIVVLGGSGVVSDGVLASLASFTASGSSSSVTRWSGSDRYGTSAAISRAAYPSGVASGVVYVATGTNFPDALAAAAVAGRSGSPLLLVAPTSVPGAIATEIRRIAPTRVVVLGGTGAVGNVVASSL